MHTRTRAHRDTYKFATFQNKEVVLHSFKNHFEAPLYYQSNKSHFNCKIHCGTISATDPSADTPKKCSVHRQSFKCQDSQCGRVSERSLGLGDHNCRRFKLAPMWESLWEAHSSRAIPGQCPKAFITFQPENHPDSNSWQIQPRKEGRFLEIACGCSYCVYLTGEVFSS